MLVYSLLWIARPIVENEFGLYLPIQMLSVTEWSYLGILMILGPLIGLIPAWKAFKNALADGLTIRV